MHRVTLIKGDGIGPEITEVAVRCIEATQVNIVWDIVEAGVDAIPKYGTPLPTHVIDSIKKNKVALKGPITTPLGYGFRSVNVALRKELDLYAGIRPSKYYNGVKTLIKNPQNIDLVVIRENTEDLYAGIEFEQGNEKTLRLIDFIKSISNEDIRKDSGISIKVISEFCSRRIIEFAFSFAKKYNRNKVTVVTKSNIMKFSDGLFMCVAEEVAKFHSINFEHKLVDNICMQLVQKPWQYDILVLPNLYGDIISDLCAGLVGGLGMAPGANIGDKYAIFEPVHGSAPKYAGLNKCNPSAMILSGVLMLRYLNEDEAANKLESAISKVIAEGKQVTYDLNPNQPSSTEEMGNAIIKAIKELS